jgi:hypothetical protein
MQLHILQGQQIPHIIGKDLVQLAVVVLETGFIHYTVSKS